MSKMTAFNFNTSAIRVVTIDGNPWFVAADVCKLLGLAIYPDGTSNVNNATRPLDRKEMQLLRRSTPHLTMDTAAALFAYRQPSLKIISESGLYKLVMRSDKPQAKPFQDWVTRVVLPAIRKDGGYALRFELKQRVRRRRVDGGRKRTQDAETGVEQHEPNKHAHSRRRLTVRAGE